MPKREFKLLNIKTGELFVLNYEIDQLTTIIVLILKGKYEKQVFKTNEVFLEDLIQYMNANTSYNILKNNKLEVRNLFNKHNKKERARARRGGCFPPRRARQIVFCIMCVLI